MHIELCDVQNTLLREIAEPQLNQKQIAMTYAMGLRSRENVNWYEVNRAIVNRWSMAGLIRIKRLALTGKAFD